MSKIAFIGGSGFSKRKLFDGFEKSYVKTQYGNVLLFVKGKVIYLARHGIHKSIPPHRINHRANICALNLLGAERIIGINSVGSLKETIKPGSIVVASDYVHLDPPSFHDFELKAITPQLDTDLIKKIKAAAKKAKVTTKNTGVYIQTKGPRFETKAEVSIIKKWGDIVGMTMASEATLAQEIGLPYASICAVDNYANGISKKKLTEATLKKTHEKTQPKMEKIIKELMRSSAK